MKIFFTALVGLLFIGCTTSNSEHEIITVPEFEDSIDAYNFYVELNPNDPEPFYQRASYLLRQGDAGNANEDVIKALTLDSTDLRFHTMYANIQLSMLNLEEVKYHYNYVIERDSQNVEALMGLAKLYALLNNFPIANLVYLNKVLEIDPYNAEAYFMRGIIYRSDFESTGNPEGLRRALSSFQTAVEQDPNYYSAYIEMGVMFDNIDSNIAIQYYNSALEIYPESPEALYNKGMYYQKRGLVDSALAQYQHILRNDSSYIEAYYNQGYIHLIMTDVIDSAIYFFEKSTEYDPFYYQAYNNLGLSHEKNGNLELAKKNFQKAIEINPNFQLAKDNLRAIE